MIKPRKIFTEQDWENADRIDRLYMYLMEPDRWVLSYEEDDYLENLRKVWAIVCKQSTPRGRMKLIAYHMNVTERTIRNYINEATRLFGDMLAIDVELELSLAYNRMMKLHDKARESGDYETARRCQDNALGILEKIEAAKPKQVKKYPTITFTSDPTALVARNSGEQIEFEDVQRVLEPQAVGVPASDSAL